MSARSVPASAVLDEFAALMRSLLGALDARDLAGRVANGLAAMLHAQGAAVFRRDPDGDLVSFGVSAGLPLGEGIVFPRGASVIGLAADRRTVVQTADLFADPRITLTPELAARIRALRYRAGLAVPLIADGQVLGAAGIVDRQGRVFTDDEIRVAQLFCDCAALSLRNAAIVAAFADAQQQYRHLIEGSIQGIYIHRDFKILLANDAFARMVGHQAAADLVHRDLTAFIAADDLPRVRAYHEARLRGDPAPERYELRGRRADGSLFWADVVASRITWHGAPAALCTLVDVTDQKALHERFLHAQKMEAVGRLAGGIAHDFNNVLTVILGRADILLSRAELPGSIRSGLQSMQGAALRAAALTRKLLVFSRQQPTQPTVVDLNGIVSGMLPILQALLGDDIEVATRLRDGLWLARIDVVHLEQVVMNLVVNARDAMPGGGRVTIETDNVELDAAYAALHPSAAPGSYVLLSVSDTGTGMDAATRARIFEPFFTTKEVGKGTGLGLSTVHGIVHEAGGHVWVYSEVGHGTTFKIYLPRVDARGVPQRGDAAGATIPTGTETLLLVDDDADVRAMLVDILEGLGYRVVSARNVEQATAAAEQTAGRLDGVVMDVVMRGMTGPDLAARIRRRHPHVKVLFISGYAGDAIRHHLPDRDAAFLSKPFSAATLARTLRALLDGERGGV
ncbi:MAG TPA: ATP-binding protein [Candidatus Tectomicrobia bacterium]|nr:ATP-binding protein [Candidatus Tectomicrobia bacterium]